MQLENAVFVNYGHVWISVLSRQTLNTLTTALPIQWHSL